MRWRSESCSVSCKGTLDDVSDDRFREALELCLDRRPQLMEVDLEKVEVGGVRAFQTLLWLASACRALDIDLELSMCREATMSVFGFERFLPLLAVAVDDGRPSRRHASK